MIQISALDFYCAGFEGLRVLDSMANLEAHKALPVHVIVADYDINSRRKGEESHCEYPAGSVFGIPIEDQDVSQEVLTRAIETAEESATNSGIQIRGQRIYKLILVRDVEDQVWIQVGNRWEEP